MYVFEQDRYVMNNAVSDKALQTTNNYSTTGLTGSESYVWTLESATGGFYLKNKKNKKYLTNTSSTSVSFQEQEDCSVWVFNFQSDETVLIQNKSNDDRFLGYTSSTSHAYRAYATSNLSSSSYPHAIKVYKLVEVSVPNFTVTFDQPETVFAETFNVTLTASPEDADIYYTLNGSTPTTTGSTLYHPEEGITLNATATIKAVAAVNGVAGAVATATYQKNEPVAESLGDIFRRVSNVSTLQDGDQIIIVNEENSKVLDKNDGTSSGNSRKADVCVINGETIQMEDNNKILTLNKVTNGWILYTDDANLLYSVKSENHLKKAANTTGLNSTQYVASISIDNNSAKIAYCGGERWIMYNDVYVIFSCYKGTQKPVQIYRKESVDAITLNETSTDNGTIISNAVNQGKVLTVNLYRQLTANMWNAICLPFDMDDAKMKALFGDGYKLRSFSGVKKEGGDVTLMFEEATTLEAGVPYIVLPTKTVERNAVVVISDVMLKNTEPEVVTIDGYTFQGIYAPTSFEANDKSIRFIGSGNKFYYPNSTNPMRAFRAYFTLPSGATTAKVGMSFDEDMGVATGIVAVDGGAVDGRIYSMSGQYVGTSTQGLPRGLYIRDGRKFVVK